MNPEDKLSALSLSEYNFLANKNPRGGYTLQTRQQLLSIIDKLKANTSDLSVLEKNLYLKFKNPVFKTLDEADKDVLDEIVEIRRSKKVRQSFKWSAVFAGMSVVMAVVTFQFFLESTTKEKAKVFIYSGLSKIGFVSNYDLAMARQDLRKKEDELTQTKKANQKLNQDLDLAASTLEKTLRDNQELNQMVEKMILNNQVTQNLKYILKRIYGDPRTKYVQDGDKIALVFDKKILAKFKPDPELWYMLGFIDSGLIRVFYDNEQILEVEAIFGRTGEETPLGEYEIKNKLYKPTWHKKETVNGKTVRRAIPFGHPDHEIGHWWMGLRKLGQPVPGSYGIHGVNVAKANEFFRKNYDWRNGSAGCPNIQEWYLHFLAQMIPLETHINIAQKDKRDPAEQNAEKSAPLGALGSARS